MNRAARRAHLEAVILSARLRGAENESCWARATLDTNRGVADRVAFLRASLAVESPGGDSKSLSMKWAMWLVNRKAPASNPRPDHER